MRMLPSLVIALTFAGAFAAEAGQSVKSQIAGTWKVTAVYDQFADGTKRQTWGAGPVGQLIMTREGTFSFMMAAADRAPKPNTVPTDPVGPSIAYFGNYTIDEKTKKISRTLIQSTFPQWKGISQTLQVESVDANDLKIAAVPIKDPVKNQEFVPHLDFVRVK